MAKTMTTANHLADNLDDLSDYLGPEDQEAVDNVLRRIGEVRFPEQYRGVIEQARSAIAVYSDLLESIDDRERFSQPQ